MSANAIAGSLARWADLAEPPPTPHADDPVAWITGVLGEELWSGQRDICAALTNHDEVVVRSAHNVGKALTLDTPIPTPDGWTTMGELQSGDSVFDEAGNATRVVAVTSEHLRETFRVTFDDGSTIDAADAHEWAVLTAERRAQLRRKLRPSGELIQDWRKYWGETEIVETSEMVGRLETKSLGRRFGVPISNPIEGEPVDLPLSPYTLGFWLGDGTAANAGITCHPDDAKIIIAHIEAEGVRVRKQKGRFHWGLLGCLDAMRELDLIKNKHIPRRVFRADISTRLEVLRGLVDSDGFISPKNSREYEIQLSDKRLADDVAELIHTFGWKLRRSTRDTHFNGKDYGLAYRLRFRPDVQVAHLPRKQVDLDTGHQQGWHNLRVVKEIEPLGMQLVKCIEVEAESHLFLAGESLIPTCNSWLAARLVAWWLATHPRGDTFVVTSAPTFHQVRAILWREIARAHAAGHLFGRLNQTEWLDGTKLVAFGRKPSDYAPDAFQGIHDTYVLVVLDEAGGIPRPLWDAADSLVSNDHSKLLAIGNPDAPGTEFAKRCMTADADRASLKIAARDSPNFTDERVSPELSARLLGAKWVETQRRRWHEGSPLWQSKIEAEFPAESEDTLIPMHLIAAARTRELEPQRPVQLACDVARFGKDETVVVRSQGNVADIVYTSAREDTMTTTGQLIRLRREHDASLIRVDAIGVGGGVVDRLVELDEPVLALDAGHAPVDPRFLNCRAEWYWQLRERFERGDISIPDDDDLANQLAALRYEYTSRGKLKIESKDDMAKRGLPSPDRADALMMAFATEPKKRQTHDSRAEEDYDGGYVISEI